jgi:RNA polymerase sigma factor (TIGR02999 family)
LPDDHAEPSDSAPDITGLLLSWASGDASADARLMPAIYGELHLQAARAMRRENDGHSLQATALVHEAYIRLVDQRRVEWRNRAHFFGIAAQAMRRILVDHARGRLAEKRGGGMRQITLGDAEQDAAQRDDAVDILDLHEALERLAELDPQQGRIVELRYFGGLNIDETAESLGISPATVKRDWAMARAWLHRELTTA